ncbi:MAG: GDSL-type esterase/lipase family protein [archaeon]
MRGILVFGSSMTQGSFDPEGGWVGRLSRYLMKLTPGERPKYKVYNMGVSGDSSKELLERIEPEIKARMRDDMIIIIAIGGNDAWWWVEDECTNHSTEEYASNLEKIFDIAKDYTDKVLCVGMTPVDEEKVNPMPWFPKASYFNRLMKQYNEVAENVCDKNDVSFIDMFSKFMELDYKKMLFDGVHMTSEGHQKMFEIVKDFLVEKKLIST